MITSPFKSRTFAKAFETFAYGIAQQLDPEGFDKAMGQGAPSPTDQPGNPPPSPSLLQQSAPPPQPAQ